MPKSVNPRAVRPRGAETSEVTSGYVTWSSMRSGLRPGHSVDTMTCTSEMSGTASSGVLSIAHPPHAASARAVVNTRNRLCAHHEMMDSIMRHPPGTRHEAPGTWSLRHQSELSRSDPLAVAQHGDRAVPAAEHGHAHRASVHAAAGVRSEERRGGEE